MLLCVLDALTGWLARPSKASVVSDRGIFRKAMNQPAAPQIVFVPSMLPVTQPDQDGKRCTNSEAV